MKTHPFTGAKAVEGGVSRRKFLRRSGAALAGGMAAASCGPAPAAAGTPGAVEKRVPESPATASRVLRRPNLVFLITDQERYPRHWPEGWAEANLPNRKRLADSGLTFTRCFCNAAMCSPSRATLFTGLYASQHGVKEVLQYDYPIRNSVPEHTSQPTLQTGTQNIAQMLADAGYNVQYRGKWHISKDPTGTLPVQSPRDLEQYGFQGWIPPEAGTDESATVFGGGDTNYDTQYAEQAADFLKKADPYSHQPFALFVCLANPHDLMGYPDTWNQPSYSDIDPFRGADNYGKVYPECFDQGVGLPATAQESPLGNFKPPAQARSTLMWASGLGTLLSHEERLNYVNFYAYLHKESDRHIGTVLDALEARRALRNKTVVFRLSDHGEMGLAHGGMREKAYNAYEETIHVPLVVSNPVLFPRAAETQALASLIDLMPTVAALAGVRNQGKWTFMGADLSPVIQDAATRPSNPVRSVQDAIYFTSDETLGESIVGQPSHIRCLREADWKVVEYYDPAGVATPLYELYDLARDPLEMCNLGNPDNTPYYRSDKLAEMVDKLHRRRDEIEAQTAALKERMGTS